MQKLTGLIPGSPGMSTQTLGFPEILTEGAWPGVWEEEALTAPWEMPVDRDNPASPCDKGQRVL